MPGDRAGPGRRSRIAGTVSRLASPRLRMYCALSAALLVAALASGRPELVALATPFLVFLTIALASSREPDLSVTVGLARDRVLEGEPLQLVVERHGRRERM